MTQSYTDDITKKQISNQERWHVQVRNPEGLNKEFDCTWQSVQTLFQGNVPKLDWYKLEKNEDTGKWERIPVAAGTVKTDK